MTPDKKSPKTGLPVAARTAGTVLVCFLLTACAAFVAARFCGEQEKKEEPEALPVMQTVPEQQVTPAASKPDENRIFNISYIHQVDAYPTACESVTAVMACRYAGIAMDTDTFIRSYLPRADFVFKKGETFGYHPNEYFMGDPYSSTSFGCYAPCIEKAIRAFLPPDYTLINTSGADLSDLCRRFISRDIPVMLWATQNMTAPQEGVEWTLFGGGTFQWIKGEHCLLMTGYDGTQYYFHDPLTGVASYEKALVETRYGQLGSQSLVLFRNRAKARCMDLF